MSGGVSIEDSAKILVDIISNKGTKAQNEVIIANAGLSIYCANPNKSIAESIALAKESLESGKALEVFKKFMALMN